MGMLPEVKAKPASMMLPSFRRGKRMVLPPLMHRPTNLRLVGTSELLPTRRVWHCDGGTDMICHSYI